MHEPIREPNPQAAPSSRGTEPLRYTGPAAISEVRHEAPWHMDWASTWSGVFVGLGIVILLVALAPAIGVGLGDTAAGIWAAISLIVGFFVGGWVTGQTLDVLDSKAAIIHGILLWAIARIFTLVLAVVVATIFLSSAVNGLLGLIPFLGNIVGELVRSPAAVAAQRHDRPPGGGVHGCRERGRVRVVDFVPHHVGGLSRRRRRDAGRQPGPSRGTDAALEQPPGAAQAVPPLDLLS